MLSAFIFASVLLESAAWTAIGIQLVDRGWSVASVVALALAWVFASRFLVVCFSTTRGYMGRSPRAPEQQLGVGGTAKLLLGETAALLISNFYALPLQRVAMRRDAPLAKGDGIPVILVHGYLSNRGLFGPVVRALEAAGVKPVVTHSFDGMFVPIEAWADELDGIVREVVERTGQPKVILVCHSMGGLVARTYASRYGPSRVAKLVTIASPHHGTLAAVRGIGPNARQMRREGAMLADLERKEGADGPGFPATSIYTVHDNLVVPQDTSRLVWARNIALAGVGHVDILLWKRLHRLLVDELREAGAVPADV